jgi:hypothetical protein
MFCNIVQKILILIEIISTDVGYRKTITQPLEREKELLKIKKKLGDWISMIPQCVTMQHSRSSPAFRNNGMCVIP